MTIREEERDLFSVPSDYYLVHCISKDFALGAGIAKQFNKKFNMRYELLTNYPSDEQIIGRALKVDRVFNLVTKEKYFHKPAYYAIERALCDLRKQVVKSGIAKLAMPRIACGLDGKDWTKVRKIIETVFDGADVEILVCVQ